MTIFTDLISNVALLLALSILYSFLTRIWKRGEIPGQILAGILFGGVAVAGMMQPFNYAPGVIFDGRSMVVSMAGLFGGPVTAAISTLIAGGYRLGLGGTGALTGFGVIFTSAALGVGYHYLRRKNPDVTKPSYLFAFGVIVHISMLLWMLTLPWPLAFEVLNKISIPVMLIFPLGTLFLGTLLADQEGRNYAQAALRESEEKYRELSDSLPQIVFETDEKGNLTFTNRVAFDILGYTREDFEKGLNALQMLIPEDHERALKNIQRVLKGEKLGGTEYTALTKDGRRYPAMVYSTPIISAGQSVGTRGIIADLTEAKRAQKALLNKSYFLQKAQEIGKIGTWELDIKKNELLWTDETYRIFGLPIGTKLTYETFLNCVHPDDREYVDKEWKEAFDKKPYDIEHRLLVDGDVKWVREKAELQFNEKDECVSGTGFAQDITDRKQAEEVLRESRETLRTSHLNLKSLLENTDDYILISDDKGSPILFNSSYARIIKELLGIHMKPGLKPHKLLPGKDMVDFWDELHRRVLRGEKFRTEYGQEFPNGDIRHFEISFTPIIENGEIKGFSELTRDITGKKRAEDVLRESERQLSIRNRIADIFLTTPDDQMYGEVLQVVLEAMESPYGTFAYIDENGDRLVPSMTRDIWDECKIPDKGIFFPRDTWGNALWARALREKKSFSSNGPFNIPDGHMPIRTALATPIIHKGESIGNLMVGDKPTDYSKKDIDLLEAIADRIAPILHVRLLNERHETEHKRAEEEKVELESQLHRAQKMEAMGLMAGGIAHDLNNILSGIVSYPELLLMDIPEDNPMWKPIKTIQESGMRAADVVEDLMTIARGVATSKEIMNFNTVVEEYLNSTEHRNLVSIRPSVTFKTQFDSDLLNVNASPTHMKKILMNLVANASEAIEGSGTVIISTMDQYLDEPLRGYEDVVTGEYVTLTVSDDGLGISQQDLERIFEPFYTKKVMDRSGTGLGLAVVWNTVQDHKGYINVRTSEKGTVFELYFPTTREQVADEGEQVPLDDYLGHGEKILVVDDEERQREIASGILNRLGYTAETVSSGEEAIEYVKEHPVDLIVLDMVMPKGINGRKTYEGIIKIRPGQKAIIASGYAKTREVDMAQELGAGKYIKKPYTLSKVGVAVKEELEK